jgi:hypothetical protein
VEIASGQESFAEQSSSFAAKARHHPPEAQLDDPK